jgi:hypothetical protein
MPKSKFKTIFFGRATFPIWLALGTFGLTEIFSRFPKAAEIIYSQTLFPVIASLLSFVSKWISFSMDDVFYAFLAVFLVILLLLVFLRKIKFGRFLLIVIQTLAVVYILFYWFWGFNYFRSGINERLEIAKAKPDTVEFVKVLESLIQKTNASYCSFDNISYPCRIVDENLEGGAELYPHIYGPLPMSAVVRVDELSCAVDGALSLPPDLRADRS